MLIYKAVSVMFLGDSSMPRAGTVARELRDRVHNGVSFPKELIPSYIGLQCYCLCKGRAARREQLKDLSRPLIVNCDNYKCHKMASFVQECEKNGTYMYHIAGGLTPKFQVIDIAPNVIIHGHMTKENMLRMLSARRDSRGYPVCMNRVQLAHCVKAGWEKVSAGLITLCALKCGIALLSDFSEGVIERDSLRSVRIDPIIQDLVCSSTVKCDFPPMQDDIGSDLYELGSLMGLDRTS